MKTQPARCTTPQLAAITVTTALVTLLLALVPAHGIDLLQRYPTTLNAGIASANNARPWQFTEADLYVLSRFNFEAGGLRVQSGPADLGIGHGNDDAVWAVVLPHMAGKLTSPAAEGAETVAHIWLRFHPKQISRLFPEQTVSTGSPTNLLSEMRLIASSKFSSSWHAGQNALIPEPKDFTVDVDTGVGVRRFFVVDTEASKADYVPAFENRAVRKAPSLTPAPKPDAFDRDRDDLLAAALERLRPALLPEKAIDGPRFGAIAKPTRKQNR